MALVKFNARMGILEARVGAINNPFGPRQSRFCLPTRAMFSAAHLVAALVAWIAPSDGLLIMSSPRSTHSPPDAIEKCIAPGSTVNVQVGVVAEHDGVAHVQVCRLPDVNDMDDVMPDECFKPAKQPHENEPWRVAPGVHVWSTNIALPSAHDSRAVVRWWYDGGG
ncbi:hypothetical protein H310_09550 [Aphanomyces invadans]|uniref:Chitin-binding type-4 domain-containing protein n=1 Tax=Aphanomyces invadans TaxID=157072 RepID=A0A024TUI5_9STRA|nr:hypothetical protein H310_09550 [Aphanomyces invadans]ETV97659.1 hypothetical protein H310_09550 [Aphanomyces invadans]|eukprot:XP_008873868.1 hypothetical protein H310_09550 [Aphanomyces invadans]